jgi:hypothetical protein
MQPEIKPERNQAQTYTLLVGCWTVILLLTAYQILQLLTVFRDRPNFGEMMAYKLGMVALIALGMISSVVRLRRERRRPR